MIDQLVTQAFDVERAALGEMQQCLFPLRRAEQAAGAARSRLALFAHDVRAADRAMRGHIKIVGLAARPVLRHHHHFGDHITGAPHRDGVAAPHILAPHFVFVVQCRIGHSDAADEHRLEPRHRRDRAGAPDLHFNVEHFGQFFLGRKLVGDGKARGARDEAQGLLRGERVNLVDHAINVIRQRAAPGANPLIKIEQSLRAVHHGTFATHRQAQRRVPIKQL